MNSTEKESDIPRYISRLLYRNDCVILPGFGGFIAERIPARIHRITHTFHPPFRSVMFNSRIIADDGLLTHAISAEENKDYSVVREEVSRFVSLCKRRLEEGRMVKMGHIGTFRIGQENKLLFEPDHTVNYLEDSYGLAPVTVPPVSRISRTVRKEMVFKDRHPAAKEIRKSVKYHRIFWAIIPLVLLGLWWFLQPGLFRTVTETGVFPGEVLMAPGSGETVETAANGKPETDPGPATGQNVPPSTSVPEEVPNDRADLMIDETARYVVIGGAFRDTENAEKLLLTLRQKGYPAGYAGTTRTGLLMVAYYASNIRSEALKALSEVRNTENLSAWLLVR
ncbi:MAG: SPOR domain-containing protein [Bacteroidales bacterium]|nr:SPOR domain-containing protein [Bacteroidales bacterium]